MKKSAQYKEMFLTEAREYVRTMNRCLVDFEKDPRNTELLQEIFRAAHTLKSIAATMDYRQTTALCHAMEGLLDAMKQGVVSCAAVADLLFEGFDAVEKLLAEIAAGNAESATGPLVQRLEAAQHGMSDAPRMPDDTGRPTQDVVRGTQDAVRTTDVISVKVERLDTLMKLAEELLIGKMRLDRIKEDLDQPELSAAVDALARIVTDLQYNIMQARMVPIGTIFDRFHRMVRDLARQEGKDVNLVTEGESLELDRSVLDQIGEPLVHLLRNAVDHGIETPEIRKKAGKPACATITLAATRSRDAARIVVADDGRGFDLDAIRAAAVKRGSCTADATPTEVLQAVFAGISTAKQVTAISGRGLGCNIVKKKIEALGGTVRIQSQPGAGAQCAIELPLTLAIVGTLFVRVAEAMFAIPLTNIERLVTAGRREIHGQLGMDGIILDGQDIPLVRLGELFHPSSSSSTGEGGGAGDHPGRGDSSHIVVVRDGDQHVGLVVDALLTTQEVVIKPLNRWLRENRYFSGSTIIGSGAVVLILDVASLVGTRKQRPTHPHPHALMRPHAGAPGADT